MISHHVQAPAGSDPLGPRTENKLVVLTSLPASQLKLLGNGQLKSCGLLCLDLLAFKALSKGHGRVRVCGWHRCATGPSEEAAAVSAAWRKRRIDGGLCERLKLIGSTTVHLHGLPGKQQADVPVEVDLPRLGTLEPGRDRTRMRRVNDTGKQQF